MTVIAYSSKHRVMAADSRCTDEHLHVTSCQKIWSLKSGAIFGGAGGIDERDLLALLEKATPRKLPTRAQLAELKYDFTGVIVFPKGQVYTLESEHVEHVGWTSAVMQIRDQFVAIGCGADFAYGALEAGADPIRAVKAACKRDINCALPVQSARLPESGKGK